MQRGIHQLAKDGLGPRRIVKPRLDQRPKRFGLLIGRNDRVNPLFSFLDSPFQLDSLGLALFGRLSLPFQHLHCQASRVTRPFKLSLGGLIAVISRSLVNAGQVKISGGCFPTPDDPLGLLANVLNLSQGAFMLGQRIGSRARLTFVLAAGCVEPAIHLVECLPGGIQVEIWRVTLLCRQLRS
jgi:hypothetical protein